MTAADDRKVTPATDLHTALEAAITARLEVARAATPGPWTAENVYRLAKGCRCLSCDEDEPYGKAIHEIDAVGDDPSPILKAADADFIALHDPADAVRRYERDLRVLARHAPFDQRNWSMARGSFTEPGCQHCELTSNDGDPLARDWPCDDISDLLDVYPEVTR